MSVLRGDAVLYVFALLILALYLTLTLTLPPHPQGINYRRSPLHARQQDRCHIGGRGRREALTTGARAPAAGDAQGGVRQAKGEEPWGRYGRASLGGHGRDDEQSGGRGAG